MQITVNGQLLTVTDDTLVSNSVGIYECEFTFDESWDGFSKTSVWKLNSDDPIEVVISNGKAVIPHEVLVNAGFLRIGVYGTKDEKVMPTVWLETRKVCLGTPTGSIGTEPTPSIYAQILAVATNAENVANEVKTEWESVSATAETLEPTESASVVFEDNTFKFGIPQGERGGDGADGFSPIVTVAPITNGHRVTITDAEGVHTFDVLDGTDGADGIGITNIVMNADYTLTITLSNGTSYTTPSIRGEQGETGNGIVSITKTATVGKVDTYTITFTDGTTTTFEVTNGAEGRSDFASYLPIDSANGTIASFSDGAEDIPVEELKVTLEPIQDLNGQSNPYPAGGGANQWDEQWEVGAYNVNTGDKGTALTTQIRSANRIAVQPSTTYYIKTPTATNYGVYVLEYAEDGTYLGVYTYKANATITTTANTHYVCIYTLTQYGNTYHNDISINYPSTDTSYHPYSNLCPISGRNSVDLVRTGENMLDPAKRDYVNGNTHRWYNTDGFLLKGGTTYTLSTNFSGSIAIYFLDYSSKTTIVYASATTLNYTPTEDIRVIFQAYSSAGVSNAELCLAVGSNVPYTPYTQGNTYPISLGQTVYGGVLDVVSGVLTINKAIVDLGTLNWYLENYGNIYRANAVLPSAAKGGTYNIPANGCCSIFKMSNLVTDHGTNIPINLIGIITTSNKAYVTTDKSTLSDFKALVNEENLVYELATPTTITLTPTEVTTLLGANNIFTTDENGTVEVTYRADIQRYVDKKISALATL